jgi:hypothetical protein
MANPTCTRDTLVASSKCFTVKNLEPHHRDALLVYFMVKELAAIGGTDYSAALTSTLLTDSVALAKTLNADERSAAVLAIAYNNAVAAGASVSTNINTLMGNIKCLVNVPDLEAMKLLLLCKLGVHKSYTQ